MPQGLVRFQESGQTHFVTFSCVGRQPNFTSAVVYNLFLETLERTRLRFAVRIYGYVVMPEHVHLLVSESEKALLSEALHYLKQSFTQRVHSASMKTGAFWEKRYYDRNVRDEEEFKIKLRYLHRNPVKRGLVTDPTDWKWSSFRHYALREVGVVEIESEWTAWERERRERGGPPRVFLKPA